MFRAPCDALEMVFTNEKQRLKVLSIVPMIEAVMASSAIASVKRCRVQCESIHFGLSGTTLKANNGVKSIATSH
jgi:hypothetical protein